MGDRSPRAKRTLATFDVRIQAVGWTDQEVARCAARRVPDIEVGRCREGCPRAAAATPVKAPVAWKSREGPYERS